MATLSFCGAAGTVTGSCSLVETDAARFLVDCGMFQGNRTVRELNRQEFPFDPAKVDFVLLTHAHIDHSGLLPKLYKHGFRGPIYATEATVDLLRFMLPDSASIQESDAARHNKKLRRRGKAEVEPIYSMEDAEETLRLFQHVDYEQAFEPAQGVRVRMFNAGHLLGSASADIAIREAAEDRVLRMLFSGDLGPDEKAFHPDPDAPDGYDYIVCESTYGNRDRDDYTLSERRAALKQELVKGLKKGGNVVIPSFAVERSQELLHDIGVLLQRREIPDATVYLDSPLARRVTEVFIKHAGELEEVEVDEEKLFRDEQFRLVASVDESIAINNVTSGAIIISASGMCDAGRIKHHLKNNIFRGEATVLFVGYQAPGTLGSIITGGAKSVRIHGKIYPVRAAIRRLGNYSAHADQGELVDWVLERAPVVGCLFLNHGEQRGRVAMRDKLVERGFPADKVMLPEFDEAFELVAGSARSKGRSRVRVPDSEIERDWHNDYASFSVELDKCISTVEDPAARRSLLERLQAVLDASD